MDEGNLFGCSFFLFFAQYLLSRSWPYIVAILVRDVSTRMMGGWRANFGFICKVREEGFVGEFF